MSRGVVEVVERWWDAVVGMLAASGLLAGCGALPWTSAEATWELDPDEQVGPASTEVDVLVSRTGCNNGVTGEVQEPDIDVGADEVVVTFRVTPGEPSAANCLGNVLVPYRLELSEPLGDRALVDGVCDEDNDTYAYCVSDGVRHRP